MGRARWRAAWLVVVSSWLALGGACSGDPLGPDPGNNLILVSFDGVRGREMFGLPDPTLSGGDEQPAFPMLRASLMLEGVMFGDTTRFDSMTTTNPDQVSIPGYMSIFTGYEQDCHDNDCQQVHVETVLEYVQRLRGYPRGEIAVFASWEKIGRALEHVVGTIYTNIGPQPGEVGRPAWAGRWDRQTFDAAMAYLRDRHPRLLYIAFLDGDAWGHKMNYPEYLAALRQYDQWIADLRVELTRLGDYGAHTTLIATTDHGRGDAEQWWDHNKDRPGSERVWLYAIGPDVAHGFDPGSTHRRTSGDIRPTIEVFFGVPPSSCVRCGAPLVEIVGEPP